MKKYADALFYISVVVVMISGFFGIIYEYLIRDKSIVPQYIFDLFTVPGYVCMAYCALWLYFTKFRRKDAKPPRK